MARRPLSYGVMAQADDTQIYVVRRDLSGGINDRSNGAVIADNEATNLLNIDIRTPGQTSLRNGSVGVTCLACISNGCFGFNPDGGTDRIFILNSNEIRSYDGTNTTLVGTGVSMPNLAYFTKIGESGEGDVVVMQDGTNRPYRINQSNAIQLLSNTSTAYQPPISIANLYHQNRWWVLKSNNLFWSDAYSTDYSQAFDQDNDYYRIPCGAERALVGLGEQGIICFGEDSVWGIPPSTEPTATDMATKIVEHGCVAPKSVVLVGNEIYYMARDGVRGLFQSQQDKLQSRTSYPMSYRLKDVVDFSWAYINQATGVFFENMYLLAVPTDSSSYNNKVIVYSPPTNGWVVWDGMKVRDWAKVRINGKERLYYIDAVTGNFVEAFVAETYTDLGSPITYREEGRKEDLGMPFVTKSSGEVYVKFLATDETTVNIYAEFDDNGYELLGAFDITGSGVTFPVTFPVTFTNTATVTAKYHIDQYGEWKTCRIRVDKTASDDAVVTVLERGILTFSDSYISEEPNG
jgi:hypothetical protein